MARNNQVAKIEEPDAEASPVGREAPTLKSSAIEVQSEGQHWREWVVRLPEGAILQDLSVPTIWKVIQGNPQKSLRVLDRLTAISWDESWLVKDVLVVEADGHSATLSIKPTDVIRLQSKAATWQDDRHVVKWAGSGFGLFRRDGDVQLGPHTYSTLEAAKHVLFKEQYTKAVVR